jgi:hypothetical protein
MLSKLKTVNELLSDAVSDFDRENVNKIPNTEQVAMANRAVRSVSSQFYDLFATQYLTDYVPNVSTSGNYSIGGASYIPSTGALTVTSPARAYNPNDIGNTMFLGLPANRFTQKVYNSSYGSTAQICIDKRGNIWYAGSGESTLHRYTPSTGATKDFTVVNTAGYGANVAHILNDDSDNIWAVFGAYLAKIDTSDTLTQQSLLDASLTAACTDGTNIYLMFGIVNYNKVYRVPSNNLSIAKFCDCDTPYPSQPHLAWDTDLNHLCMFSNNNGRIEWYDFAGALLQSDTITLAGGYDDTAYNRLQYDSINRCFWVMTIHLNDNACDVYKILTSDYSKVVNSGVCTYGGWSARSCIVLDPYGDGIFVTQTIESSAAVLGGVTKLSLNGTITFYPATTYNSYYFISNGAFDSNQNLWFGGKISLSSTNTLTGLLFWSLLSTVMVYNAKISSVTSDSVVVLSGGELPDILTTFDSVTSVPIPNIASIDISSLDVMTLGNTIRMNLLSDQTMTVESKTLEDFNRFRSSDIYNKSRIVYTIVGEKILLKWGTSLDNNGTLLGTLTIRYPRIPLTAGQADYIDIPDGAIELVTTYLKKMVSQRIGEPTKDNYEQEIQTRISELLNSYGRTATQEEIKEKVQALK